MIATAAASAPAYSVDPTGMAVRAALTPAAFHAAARPADAVAGAPQRLDIDRLYPTLSRADAPQPSKAAVAVAVAMRTALLAVSLIASNAGAFR